MNVEKMKVKELKNSLHLISSELSRRGISVREMVKQNVQ